VNRANFLVTLSGHRQNR